MNPYDDAKLELRPAGVILRDGVEIASTLQCCHCNAHFISRRGSGQQRGFCMRCGRVTCGRRKCDSCKPFERWLEEVERKATYATRLGL
jgi:hypothetical protein